MGATILTTLGSIALVAPDGRELRAVLQQPKRFALLVHLALAQPGGFVRRERMLAMFWPESDESHARDALNSSVRFLRRELGDEAIVSRGDSELGVSAEHIECDAVQLLAAFAEQRHHDAVSWHGGPLLDGFHISGAAGFSDWLDSERVRLRDIGATSSRRYAEVLAKSGDADGAARHFRIAADLAPYDEGATRRLVEFLAEVGDRAGALHELAKLTERLANEFDASPSPDTRLLLERVRHALAARDSRTSGN